MLGKGGKTRDIDHHVYPQCGSVVGRGRGRDCGGNCTASAQVIRHAEPVAEIRPLDMGVKHVKKKASVAALT